MEYCAGEHVRLRHHTSLLTKRLDGAGATDDRNITRRKDQVHSLRSTYEQLSRSTSQASQRMQVTVRARAWIQRNNARV